jgi:ElaB/YqjD/DUF883 family membrane-anchored ribosome-binding protein
MHAQDLVG